MTRRIFATEAKAHILWLLDDVAGGDQIEITEHGRTAARLVPASGPAALRGRFSGVARTAAAEELLFMTDSDWQYCHG